jgi:hypothetical protein
MPTYGAAAERRQEKPSKLLGFRIVQNFPRFIDLPQSSGWLAFLGSAANEEKAHGP